jgi:putative transcriptional regulator
MTELGKYFKHKSVNKSEIARKTGISSSRLSELSRNEKTKIKAEELYLISLALDISPIEIIEKLFRNFELKN